jgi:hypothetical protein
MPGVRRGPGSPTTARRSGAGIYNEERSRDAVYTMRAIPAASSPAGRDPTCRPAPPREPRTASSAALDINDDRDSDDITEPTLRKLPIDNTEPKEPKLPMLAHDPTLATDSTEPREAMDRTLSVDHSDHLEPPDAMLMDPRCRQCSVRATRMMACRLGSRSRRPLLARWPVLLTCVEAGTPLRPGRNIRPRFRRQHCHRCQA